MSSKTINNLGIIIAAGGSGRRYGSGNKLFEMLDSKPLFVHTVLNFHGCCPDSNLIFAAPAPELDKFRSVMAEYLPGNRIIFTAGGDSRGQSVKNGLAMLGDDVEYVAVHDAARPLASVQLLVKCLEIAVQYGGAVPAKPVTDTIKRTDDSGKIMETIDRSALWRVETPQVFTLAGLKAAYKLADKDGMEFTDDAGVMEHAGLPVHIVHNPDNNLKITYSEDIRLLEYVKFHQ
ncbi:MAG: 2-C-methyl-D-erythritol 4-phosphate cytidylyltransferase [Victivallaceae bacterium]|jgi:2-C-methyl-D-erythritol 4-phosphate cytidylyltransferase